MLRCSGPAQIERLSAESCAEPPFFQRHDPRFAVLREEIDVTTLTSAVHCRSANAGSSPPLFLVQEPAGNVLGLCESCRAVSGTDHLCTASNVQDYRQAESVSLQDMRLVYMRKLYASFSRKTH
jgi:hypothetical protein